MVARLHATRAMARFRIETAAATRSAIQSFAMKPAKPAMEVAGCPTLWKGPTKRPALKRLLADIEAGMVDIIGTYKIDRLSRSLMDFAKLVDVFDRHSVTFVSVTQAFNTTTSMGRLTLNIILSFARFEREVIGERIRDEFAASRKRGMWMGGHPPGSAILGRSVAFSSNTRGRSRVRW